MNDIFYHITSASLSWNPFIHFLHTLHSIPSPDIVTGWHILCLIYFLYNTSLNQTRTEISTFLMSLHQALLPSPPQRVHQALSLARWPGTLPPSPLWAPDTYVLKALWVNDPLSSPPTAFLDHMLSVPTQSLDKWNIIIFYILNRPLTLRKKIWEEHRKYLETRNHQSPKCGCDLDNTERDGGGTWPHRLNWGNMSAHGMET